MTDAERIKLLERDLASEKAARIGLEERWDRRVARVDEVFANLNAAVNDLIGAGLVPGSAVHHRICNANADAKVTVTCAVVDRMEKP